MSDPDKVTDSLVDTQATYDPVAEEVTQIPQLSEESAGENGSQDFQLIISEETVNNSQDEAQTNETSHEPLVTTQLTCIISDDKMETKTDAPATVKPSVDVSATQKENKSALDEETDKKENKAVSDDDDDEDFIEGTQIETCSPLKLQLMSLNSALSQKRKADANDETPAKFPRTCSQEDALSSIRKQVDEDKASLTIGASKDLDNEDDPLNVIIQETQESLVDESNTESLQQVEEELEQALSQHIVNSPKSCDDDNSEKLSPVKEKSSKAEFTKEKSPVKEMIVEEVSKNAEIDKFVKPLQENSKETEKSEPKSDTVESTEDLELGKKEELMSVDETADTKDKVTEDSVQVQPTRRSDDSGIGSVSIDGRKTDSGSGTVSQGQSMSSDRSRKSIEVIYDRATAPPEKKRPRELVEIDEDGEKIVLDSSQEGCDKSMEKCVVDTSKTVDTSYKTCDSKTTSSSSYKTIDSSGEFKSGYSLTNGSAESKRSDTDGTASVASDLLEHESSLGALSDKRNITLSPSKKSKAIAPFHKINEYPEVLSISDSEGDSFVADERLKNKSNLVTNVNNEHSGVKILHVEKEINIYVKLKCLLQIDENTKEYVGKILTNVHCESYHDLSSSRRRNSDASASMADISGNENKDASPGSVTSNPQPYQLNPRFSLVSTVSSSSSSSAASLIAKIPSKDSTQFQLPRGPAKHAKKTVTEAANADNKQAIDESVEQLKKEWKNINLLTNTVMNFANVELQTADIHNGASERVDTPLERIRSSTPEVDPKDATILQVVTPKSTKRGRAPKRSRSKGVRSSPSNGLTKTSPTRPTNTQETISTPSSSKRRKSSPEFSSPSRQSTTLKEVLNETTDELIGKEVFAKWSDNLYYPGTVTAKSKAKFKVNFYDGKNKMLIQDFIVPMPAVLNEGLSVYATSKHEDYGSCGIIVDVRKVKDVVTYTVETDEGEKLHVNVKDIFLTNDQAQVLREELKVELKSPPSTPQHLSKVSLDNMVEGKRRSRRIATPLFSTPKTKRARGSLADKAVDVAKPSVSGVTLKSDQARVDNEEKTSDSNSSMVEEVGLLGVQPEVIGTPNQQVTKGPASRIKGKGRSRKKSEDQEVVATLGPIPSGNSNIFKGMSFILTCASLESIDRYQQETKDSNSDTGTENEEEWTRKPFVKDRLIAQITAGGGKFYETFELVPREEYDNTKLITNVPNLTAKSLLCLSVGIKAHNHKWIIRCCQENQIVNPSEEELPAGWSLTKQSYIEMFQRPSKKPFQTLPVIVVIPVTPSDQLFVSFWREICENAGGTVLLIQNPSDGFIEGTVVLTNSRCPSWVIEKAASWNMPLVSTSWVVQSLIEGKICTYDAHPSFEYNYIQA